MFLLDSSGSVGFELFRKKKEFIRHMVDGLNIGPDATHVGIATFSSNSRVEFGLNSYTVSKSIYNALNLVIL